MAKIIPFPLEKLYLTPEWHNCPGLAKLALVNILFPWWLGNCPEINLESDAELQQRSSFNNMNWLRNRDHVKRALKDLLPAIGATHRKLMIKKAKIDAMNEKASQRLAAYRERLYAKAREKHVFVETDLVNNHHSVKLEPQLVSKIDPVIAAQAAARFAPKPQGLLRDK